jgi:hypothetical protein
MLPTRGASISNQGSSASVVEATASGARMPASSQRASFRSPGETVAGNRLRHCAITRLTHTIVGRYTSGKSGPKRIPQPKLVRTGSDRHHGVAT